MAASILDLRSRQEPYWSYRWAAQIPGFETLYAGKPLYIEACDLPVFRTFGQNSVVRGARTFSYAGPSEGPGQFSVSFYEDNELRILGMLVDWNDLIQDPATGDYNLPSIYKRDIDVALEDLKGNVIKTVRLLGSYPVSVTPYALQSTAAERVIAQAMFSADGIEVK